MSGARFTAPRVPRRAARAASTGAYAFGAVVAAALEAVARVEYAGNEHLLGQRLAEYHGHAALAFMAVALAARPLARVTVWPLRARRAIGVLAFLFASAHTWYAFVHSLGGTLDALAFLTPGRLAALWLGVIALAEMLPLFLTSNDYSVRRLGRAWKPLHALAAPALVLAVAHTVWMGAHYGVSPVEGSSAALIVVLAALFLWRARRARA